ncbi:MAG TPA: SMP-30/gluconolactonase/LRE family protein [Gemmatimonadales bacterium]
MKLVRRGVVLVLALAVLYLVAKPVPIDPLPWKSTPNAGFTGPFAANTLLTGADTVQVPAEGPEDLTLGPDGMIYTGLVDGSIVRFDPATGAVTPFARTDGRPLGIRFDAAGNLIVADALRGVLAVAPNSNVRLLTQSAGGVRFGFTDAIDVAPDGTIWFSDASQRWGAATRGLMDFWEARPTGRLLRYDPASGQTTVALDSLDFANGVAVGPAGAYVLVNETMTSRIHRLWLSGPRSGVREVFVEGLPGAPDNIAWDGQGIFWVGLFAPRTAAAERVRTLPPFWRKVLYRIPERLRGSPVTRYGMVVGIDTTGTVRYNLQDPTGRFHSTTGALRVGDTIYVSTLARDVLARVTLPPR